MESSLNSSHKVEVQLDNAKLWIEVTQLHVLSSDSVTADDLLDCASFDLLPFLSELEECFNPRFSTAEADITNHFTLEDFLSGEKVFLSDVIERV